MLHTTQCCGLREISGLSSLEPEQAMKKVCQDFFRTLDKRRGAFIIFTEAQGYYGDYGTNFKKFIIEENLGAVIESESKRNPNSGNSLKTFVWAIRPRRLYNWYQKNK